MRRRFQDADAALRSGEGCTEPRAVVAFLAENDPLATRAYDMSTATFFFDENYARLLPVLLRRLRLTPLRRLDPRRLP